MNPESAPPIGAGVRREVWIVTYLVLAIFLVVMLVVLYGCYCLLVGGIKNADVASVAAVSGLVGAIVGATGANAQTALSTIFGGSITNGHSPRAITDASTTINANSVGAIDDSRQTDPKP